MTREKAIKRLELHKRTWLLGGGFDLCDALELAIAALKERETVTDSHQFKNKPLEYLEVFDLRGEPVWIVWPDGRIKDCWWIVGSHEWNMIDFDDNLSAKDYGKVWIAYRRKPEVEG